MRRFTVILAVLRALSSGLYFAFWNESVVTESSGTIRTDPSDSTKVIETESPPHEYTVRGLTAADRPYVLLILSIPVLIATAPLGVKKERQRGALVVAALLTLGFAVVGAMSVGLLYFPNVVLLALAAAMPGPRSRAMPGPRT